MSTQEYDTSHPQWEFLRMIKWVVLVNRWTQNFSLTPASAEAVNIHTEIFRPRDSQHNTTQLTQDNELPWAGLEPAMFCILAYRLMLYQLSYREQHVHVAVLVCTEVNVPFLFSRDYCSRLDLRPLVGNEPVSLALDCSILWVWSGSPSCKRSAHCSLLSFSVSRSQPRGYVCVSERDLSIRKVT